MENDMENIMTTLRVSTTVSVNLKHHNTPVTFDWAKVPEEKRQALAEYLFDFALRQSPGDADSGMAKKGKSPAECKKAVREKFDRIALGDIPAGGGGGRGATLDDEDEALRRMWNSGKKVADEVKVGEFHKELAARVRKDIIAALREEGMDDETLKNELQGYITGSGPSIIAGWKEDPAYQIALKGVQLDRGKITVTAVKPKLVKATS
jgi:hypothetical protein